MIFSKDLNQNTNGFKFFNDGICQLQGNQLAATFHIYTHIKNNGYLYINKSYLPFLGHIKVVLQSTF